MSRVTNYRGISIFEDTTKLVRSRYHKTLGAYNTKLVNWNYHQEPWMKWRCVQFYQYTARDFLGGTFTNMQLHSKKCHLITSTRSRKSVSSGSIHAGCSCSTGGWMVRALVCQADGRVFESNQWLSFDFQILSYLLRFKIRVSTLCASFRTSHSWAYSPVTAVWSPSGQLAGCGLDYGCGRRRTMSIPVRLRAAILGAKRSYSCSSDCLVLRLCQLLSSIYD